MASVNKVIIIGNLGRDPEVRYTANGAAICNLSVATTRNWKDKDGNKQEETEWHRVSVFDKLAEICGDYLKKGRPVYFEGRLKTRKWQDKDGKDVYTTEIIADQMQLLGDREQSDRPAPRAPTNGTPRQSAQPQQSTGTAFDDMESDIPFASPHACHDPLMSNRKANRTRAAR